MAVADLALDTVIAQQWGQILGRLPKPAPILAGAALATLIYYTYKYLTDLTYAYMAIFMNGLVYEGTCSRVIPTTFRYSTGSANCITGYVGYPVSAYNLANLPAAVRDLFPGVIFYLQGISSFALDGVTPFFADGDYYRVAARPAPNVRPRPYWGPIGIPDIPYAPASAAGHPAYPAQYPLMKPWPVWRSQNPALPMQPAPPQAARERSRWDHRLGGRWATAPGRPLAPDRPLNPTRPIVRARPASNTREVKIGANSAQMQIFFAFVKAREGISEVIDFIDAMYDALPSYIRAEYGGKDANDGQKMLAVMTHLKSVDGSEFIKNFVEMTLTDWVIGNTWFGGQKALRDKVFGNRVGTFGPTNFAGGFEGFAKWVSERVSKSLEPVWDELDRLDKSGADPGYEDKPRT